MNGNDAGPRAQTQVNGEDRCDFCNALCGHASRCYECGNPKRRPAGENLREPPVKCETCDALTPIPEALVRNTGILRCVNGHYFHLRPLDEAERRGYEQAMSDRCELTKHEYEDGLTPDFARTEICRWCGKRLMITRGIFE